MKYNIIVTNSSVNKEVANFEVTVGYTDYALAAAYKDIVKAIQEEDTSESYIIEIRGEK